MILKLLVKSIQNLFLIAQHFPFYYRRPWYLFPGHNPFIHCSAKHYSLAPKSHDVSSLRISSLLLNCLQWMTCNQVFQKFYIETELVSPCDTASLLRSLCFLLWSWNVYPRELKKGEPSSGLKYLTTFLLLPIRSSQLTDNLTLLFKKFLCLFISLLCQDNSCSLIYAFTEPKYIRASSSASKTSPQFHTKCMYSLVSEDTPITAGESRSGGKNVQNPYWAGCTGYCWGGCVCQSICMPAPSSKRWVPKRSL